MLRQRRDVYCRDSPVRGGLEQFSAPGSLPENYAKCVFVYLEQGDIVNWMLVVLL